MASGAAAVGSISAASSAAPRVGSLLDTSTLASYTVRSGDTLESIAARTGTSVTALAAANHLSDPNLIIVGQVLVVSRSAAAPSVGTGAGAGTYTVQSGDTLGSIAALLGTTVDALAAANHLSDPNLIVIGQVLSVGGSAGPSTAAPVATTSPTLVSRETYTVQDGDTLASIAARLGTTVDALAAANHLSDPNLIVVGQVLSLSGGTASPTVQTPTDVPAPGPAAAVAVRVALEQLGKPYVYAGAGPSNYDCSGLVMYAYAAAGVTLVHYTVAQYDETTPVSEDQLQPGDLVFYNTGSGAQPGHVAMYIGGGMVVASNSPGTFVQTQPLDWDGTIMGFRRVT